MAEGWGAAGDTGGAHEAQQRDASTLREGHTCSGCGAGFCSRTALFKHLRGEPAGSGCSAVAAHRAAQPGGPAAGARGSKESRDLESAVVFALRRRLLRVGRRSAQPKGKIHRVDPKFAS
jgi:hypothetical protein